LDPLTNTAGRGPLGTGTNNPMNDPGTGARVQNRPNVPQGAEAGVVVPSSTGHSKSASTLSNEDWVLIEGTGRGIDGSIFPLQTLLQYRDQNMRRRAEALRDHGPDSWMAQWYQAVVEQYDRLIAEAKSPLGTAIEELRSVVNSSSTDKERREKAGKTFAILRQMELSGQADDDPRVSEAMKLIVDLIKLDAREKKKALATLVEREKRSPGSVSEDQFKDLIAKIMGGERQEQLLGIEDEDDDDSPPNAMTLVADSLNLVADRRVATLKNLIAQEKRFPGSVSELQMVRLVQAVMGDERQKELMGIPGVSGSGMTPVIDTMKLFLEKRRNAVAALFKKQSTPGSGVTSEQVNQAIADYDVAKRQAIRMGIAVPDAPDMPDQRFDTQSQPSDQ
jgi:hypothetical protein